MEIPNTLKGHYYPSSRVPKCPRFHRCTVTNKCQNYDRHLLECNICESRTNLHEVDGDSVPLGGHLPEGEYYPDLQDAFATLEKLLGTPFAHPDMVGQQINGADIARQWEKEHRVTEIIRRFSALGTLQMQEEIMNAMVDPNIANLLGRME